MIYAAIVTDVDGTMLDSPRERYITKRLARAISALQAKGIKICLATARSLTYMQPILKDLALSDPIIVSGGARIVQPQTSQELWSRTIAREDLREVVAILSEYPYGCLWNEYNEVEYLKGGWKITALDPANPVYFLESCFIPLEEAYKIIAKLQEIKEIRAILTKSDGTLDGYDIHITSSAADKEQAMYKLQGILGLSVSNCIAVGDGYGDIYLFKAVGHTVAMGNAVDELRRVADEVIGDVKADGLAIYFEQLEKTVVVKGENK